MVDYSVYENQWLFAALFGGGALIVMFVLTYWAMWRPRREEKKAAGVRIAGVSSLISWAARVVPWAIIIAAAGLLVYSIHHTYMASLRPPNW